MTVVEHRMVPGPRSDRLGLVVVERGAVAPELRADEDDEWAEIVLVSQAEDERPADLALRTVRRMAALEKSRRFVTEATLVLGEGDERPRLAARDLITRTILSHMTEAKQGQLMLAAEAVQDPEIRHALIVLVGDLARELEPCGITIGVRFTPPEPRKASGVQRIVLPSEED
jgi:hypothetical protein